MNLKRFTILTKNEAQNTSEKTSILINPEHIISVKPIKMATPTRDVIDGYWLRLSNGKKYRAVQVPEFILKSFEEELPQMMKNTESTEHAYNVQ